MNRSTQTKVLIGAVSVLAVGAANAALPDGAGTAFTGLSADALLVIAAAYPVMLAVKGGWVIFDMVKRGLSKAAK